MWNIVFNVSNLPDPHVLLPDIYLSYPFRVKVQLKWRLAKCLTKNT